MPPKQVTVKIKRNVPDQQYRKWINNKLVVDNQDVHDGKFKMSVTYVARSDHWWADQHVTTLDGRVWQTDVFEYGEAYVILMTDGKKIRVVHDGGINWHVI